MNSETIMQSDVLDIIFETRNKLYGAYTLRKFYNNRLIKSLSIAMGAAIVLSAFTFIHEKDGILIPVTEVSIATIKQAKATEVKKELPREQTKSSQSSQKKFLIPVILDNTMKPDTLQDIKPADRISNTNSIVPGDEAPVTFNEPLTDPGSEGQKPALPVIDLSQPIDNPEIEPTYPGGINALRKFLERNLVNPTEMNQGEMVAVHVKFVVGYDGKLQQFTVVKDGGEIFNKEVIRVLKKMPQWVPGKSRGQNVAVYFTIPVKFVPAD